MAGWSGHNIFIGEKRLDWVKDNIKDFLHFGWHRAIKVNGIWYEVDNDKKPSGKIKIKQHTNDSKYSKIYRLDLNFQVSQEIVVSTIATFQSLDYDVFGLSGKNCCQFVDEMLMKAGNPPWSMYWSSAPSIYGSSTGFVQIKP